MATASEEDKYQSKLRQLKKVECDLHGPLEYTRTGNKYNTRCSRCHKQFRSKGIMIYVCMSCPNLGVKFIYYIIMHILTSMYNYKYHRCVQIVING